MRKSAAWGYNDLCNVSTDEGAGRKQGLTINYTSMKFNFFKAKKVAISNYENAPADVMEPAMELYTSVVTTSLSHAFYELEDDRRVRINALISRCNPEFIAKLAVYARSTMNLRSVPLALIVELAKKESGNGLVSRSVTRVVQRADEITELLACYQLSNDRKGTKKLNSLSKQIQKGLANSFNKFDVYQFAKYNRKTDVELRDALFLVHPKAKDELQQQIFDQIATGTLATPYTWETELSALGQSRFENADTKATAFKLKWEELLTSKKLGYMALLRNLRNILTADVSAQHIELIAQYLANETAVKGSKQLPFRFLAAYRELQTNSSKYTGVLLEALESAVQHSANNISGFGFDTSIVIACDVSGSMQTAIAPKSSVQLFDIGLMLAMLLQARCKNVITGMFGDTWKIIQVPKNNVLANVLNYREREGEVGYATNGYLVIEDLIKRKIKVDKVMFFTDAQLWNSNNTSSSFSRLWLQYKKRFPLAKLYLFDLAGYGKPPLQIEVNDVYVIAGWSDKIFDVLDALENKMSVIDQINQIDI